MKDRDVLVLGALDRWPRSTTAELASLTDMEQDCVRGTLERLREEGRASMTQTGGWVRRDPNVHFGRPRPAQTVRLDEEVRSLIGQEPRTALQLASLTGVSPERVYLSLNRLRRKGQAQIGPGRNPYRFWSVPSG